MLAIAEGFELLQHKEELWLDLAQVAQVWRHRSVVRSWLLDLTVAIPVISMAVRRRSRPPTSRARSTTRAQRPLWASTGTKSDALPGAFYVYELVGGPTVNTVPPATLDAFLDHGTAAPTLARDVAGARERMTLPARIGVDFERITADLQGAGVKSFVHSFASLLSGVETRMERLRG